jgi:hypothetical protein
MSLMDDMLFVEDEEGNGDATFVGDASGEEAREEAFRDNDKAPVFRPTSGMRIFESCLQRGQRNSPSSIFAANRPSYGWSPAAR